MNINVEVDLSKLNLDTGAIENVISKELEDTSNKIERTAKELVPVDTGDLKNSITAKGGGLKYEITADTDYAAYIEYGTKPHTIEGNPYLSIDGNAVRSVEHPGNKAYKYMETAYDTHIDGIEDRIAEAIDKVL